MEFDKTTAMMTETASANEEPKRPSSEGHVDQLLNRVDTAAADEVDDAILRANGHDAVLQRQFKWISALGLAFSITNSWIGYLV